MAQIVLWNSKKDICEKEDLNFRTVKKMIKDGEIDSIWVKYKRKLRNKDEVVDKMILC